MVVTQSPGHFEIQLGHLCNNRCVFCVSGQLTHTGDAPLLPEADLVRALDDAWRAGHRRVTLLGGEPTIQPAFMGVLRHAIGLGFEVVIFSNGSKPGRTDLVDEVARIGGHVEWRFSFQGATEEAHERTTRRKGSFAQLLASVDRVRAHGQRTTINMCVVQQNYASVAAFPDLLLPRGVASLHLDMVNPYDTGTLTADGVTAILPRYTDIVPSLERMIAGFPEAFDVTIGNLPYCVAPALARTIHFGGAKTWTVTANDHGAGELGPGRKKYALKQAFMTKPETCRACVFDDRCKGVFDAYVERFGTGELAPVTAAALEALDRDDHLFSVRVLPIVREAVRRLVVPAPLERIRIAERSPREVEIAFGGDAADPPLVLAIVPGAKGAFAAGRFAARITRTQLDEAATLDVLRALWDALLEGGAAPLHPPGPADLPPSVASRLGRLRQRAPFGELAWHRVRETEGGVNVELRSPSGEELVMWITETEDRRPRSGYRVEAKTDPPSDALVRGARELLVAIGRLPNQALEG